MQVVLDKGPKGEKRFPDESPYRARQRAKALADLHTCDYVELSNVIFVYAAAYYASKSAKG